MSTQRLVVCITLLSIFAMAARISMDTDTWWHLRAGEWMISHKSILLEDQFSFTRYHQAWHYPGWIVQVPMYLIYRYLGPGGLNIWTAAMVVAAFCFLWGALSGGTFLKAFLMILAATATGVYWSARPHLLTFVLSAATLYILEKANRSPSSSHKKQLFWLPVIMLLWVNGHGGFAVGFILWGIYWFSQQVHWIGERTAIQKYKIAFNHPRLFIKDPDFTLTFAGVLMVIAVGFNPSGLEMITYPFKTLAIGALRDYIQEWQSPDFHSLNVQPFIWLIILTFGSVGLSKQKLSLTDFLLFSVFLTLGVMAGRNIALFGLIAPVIISRHLSTLVPELEQKSGITIDFSRVSGKVNRAINLVIFFLVSLAVLAKISLTLPAEANFVEFKKYLPIEAVSILNQSNLNKRLFNPYNWGGYLLWAAPDTQVFIDGRTDLYDDEVIQEWLKVSRVEKGWEDVLKRYQIGTIISESGSVLAKSLEMDGNWSNIYQDSIAVIYQRKDSFE